MRRLLIAFITILLLTHCSKKESETVDDLIQNLRETYQTFKVNPDHADSFVTKNGVRLIIPANTFVFHDGSETSGSIQIEVREIFDKTDMVLNNIGTTSNGRLLESYGMVKLTGTSDRKELKIKSGSSIRILIPNKRNGEHGELFYGLDHDGMLNWNYAGEKKDTTEVVQTITEKSEGRDIIIKTYKIKDGLRELISDTVYFMKFKPGYDYAAISDNVPFIPEYYEFQIQNLGWINCDRFIEVTDKTDLEVELKTYNKPIAYIVFADINSVMEIFFDDKGNAVVENLPNSYLAEIIIIDKIKDELVWLKSAIKLGTESRLILEPQKINKGDLSNELRKIDK